MPAKIKTRLKNSLIPALAIAMAVGMVQPTSAAPEKDTSATTDTKTKDETKKSLFKLNCKDGKVWVKEKRSCVDKDMVKPEDQSSLYELGRDYAYIDEYEKAVEVLSAAPDQNDPRVLNMLGYSSRKSGKMEVALGYYKRAIAIDPNYSLVREYLGEAYLQMGNLEQARAQLTEIERICGGRSCDEYGKLASLIVEKQL